MNDESIKPQGDGIWTPLVNDMDAPGTVGWDAMPLAARAAACFVALGAGFVLDTAGMRYNPQTKIAFAWRPNPIDAERKQVTQVWVNGDEAVFMDRIRAIHGARAETVQKLVHPPKRWFPARKKS